MSVINLANLLYGIVMQTKLDNTLKQSLQSNIQNLSPFLLSHKISNTEQDFALGVKLLKLTSVEEKAEILISFFELINQDICRYLYNDDNFLNQKISFLNKKIHKTNIEIEQLKKQTTHKASLNDNTAVIQQKLKIVTALNEQINLLGKVLSLRCKTNSSEFTQNIKSINEQLQTQNNLLLFDHQVLSQMVAAGEVFEEKSAIEKKLNQTAFRSNRKKVEMVEHYPEDLVKRINSPYYAYAIGLFALYQNETEQLRLQHQPQKLAVLKAKYVDLKGATQAIMESGWTDNTHRISHLKRALMLNDQQYQLLAKHTSWIKKILYLMVACFGFTEKNCAKSSFAHSAKPSFFATQTTNKYQHLLSQVEQLEEVSEIIEASQATEASQIKRIQL